MFFFCQNALNSKSRCDGWQQPVRHANLSTNTLKSRLLFKAPPTPPPPATVLSARVWIAMPKYSTAVYLCVPPFWRLEVLSCQCDLTGTTGLDWTGPNNPAVRFRFSFIFTAHSTGYFDCYRRSPFFLRSSRDMHYCGLITLVSCSWTRLSQGLVWTVLSSLVPEGFMIKVMSV